jgi:acetolactate synthase-1/2/3 large subunit
VVVHVDSVAAELDGHYQPSVEVVGELDEALAMLTNLASVRAGARPARATEPADATRSQEGADALSTRGTDGPFAPERVVRALRDALAALDIVICDVGAHKAWLASHYATATPNTVVISNGLASMGIALPGAIAAKLVHPDRRVVAFTGDAGFMMNVQELETAKRLGVAIVVVVLVDGHLGAIEVNERRLYGRTFATEFGNPDFARLAESFGIAGYSVQDESELKTTLRRALDLGKPAVVAVPWDHEANQRLAGARAE